MKDLYNGNKLLKKDVREDKQMGKHPYSRIRRINVKMSILHKTSIGSMQPFSEFQ